jgi:hypothetical protein
MSVSFLLVVVVVLVVEVVEGFSTTVVQLDRDSSKRALKDNSTIFFIDLEGEVEALARLPWAPWSPSAPLSSRNSRRVP